MKVVKYLTIPITKIDKERRIVEGYVTTESVDRDGQIVDLEMVKEAWPDYSRYGNIRRMHQPDVVGKMKEGTFDEKGLYAISKVVDDAVWKGFEEGLYSGYSIGLANVRVVPDAKAPKGRITKKADGTMPFIPEISYVDRPSNPDADFTMVYKFGQDKVEIAKIAPVDAEFWKDFDDRLAKASIAKQEGEQPPAPAPEPAPAPAPMPEATPVPEPASPAPAPAPETTTPAPVADPAPITPEATKELSTFATVWAAENLSQELPVMLDVLWRTILSIAYNGEAGGAEKKSALVKTIEEFAEKCNDYMTGEKLAAVRSLELFRNSGAHLFQLATTDKYVKMNFDKAIEKLKRPTEPEKDIKEKTFELPEFLKGLTAEKFAAMEKAVSEVGSLVAANEELEKRLKTIEDTPLPPKGIQKTETTETPVSDAKVKELADEARKLGGSADSIERAAGEKLGQVIFKVFGAVKN